MATSATTPVRSGSRIMRIQGMPLAKWLRTTPGRFRLASVVLVGGTRRRARSPLRRQPTHSGRRPERRRSKPFPSSARPSASTASSPTPTRPPRSSSSRRGSRSGAPSALHRRPRATPASSSPSWPGRSARRARPETWSRPSPSVSLCTRATSTAPAPTSARVYQVGRGYLHKRRTGCAVNGSSPSTVGSCRRRQCCTPVRPRCWTRTTRHPGAELAWRPSQASVPRAREAVGPRRVSGRSSRRRSPDEFPGHRSPRALTRPESDATLSDK